MLPLGDGNWITLPENALPSHSPGKKDSFSYRIRDCQVELLMSNSLAIAGWNINDLFGIHEEKRPSNWDLWAAGLSSVSTNWIWDFLSCVRLRRWLLWSRWCGSLEVLESAANLMERVWGGGEGACACGRSRCGKQNSESVFLVKWAAEAEVWGFACFWRLNLSE